MSKQKVSKEILVALLPRKTALKRLQKEGWYHLPVENASKRWPPESMAFFQGQAFGEDEAYKIRYFGDIERIDVCSLGLAIVLPGSSIGMNIIISPVSR
jgi:hypothetical protein